MKKIFFVVLICFFFLAGQAFGLNSGIVGTSSCTKTGSGFTCVGSGDLLCENFECTSGCAASCGDDSYTNCFKTWTLGVLTVNNHASGLEGTYSKNTDTSTDNNNGATWSTFTAGSPRYAFERFKIGTFSYTSTASTKLIFSFRDGGGSHVQLCSLGVKGDTADGNKMKFRVSDGTNGAFFESPLPAANTEYCVWLEFTRNQANGCTGYITERSGGSCTKPSGVSLSATSKDYDAGEIFLQAYYSSTDGSIRDVRHDRIRVGSSAFGNQ